MIRLTVLTSRFIALVIGAAGGIGFLAALVQFSFVGMFGCVLLMAAADALYIRDPAQ